MIGFPESCVCPYTDIASSLSFHVLYAYISVLTSHTDIHLPSNRSPGSTTPKQLCSWRRRVRRSARLPVSCSYARVSASCDTTALIQLQEHARTFVRTYSTCVAVPHHWNTRPFRTRHSKRDGFGSGQAQASSSPARCPTRQVREVRVVPVPPPATGRMLPRESEIDGAPLHLARPRTRVQSNPNPDADAGWGKEASERIRIYKFAVPRLTAPSYRSRRANLLNRGPHLISSTPPPCSYSGPLSPLTDVRLQGPPSLDLHYFTHILPHGSTVVSTGVSTSCQQQCRYRDASSLP